jgi:methyl-accepting chemotaxis protein
MKWFADLRLANKLLTAFVAMAFVTGTVGFLGVRNIRELDDADTRLYTNMTVPIGELGQMTQAFQRIRVNLRDLLLSESEQEVQQHVQTIRELAAGIDNNAADFEKTILSAQVAQAFADCSAALRAYAPQRDKFVGLVQAGKKAEATALLRGDLLRMAKDAETRFDRLQQLKLESAKETSDSNTALANSAATRTWTLIVVALALALGLGTMIARMIAKPVKAVAERAEELRRETIATLGKASEAMARGDLSADVETDVRMLDITGKDEVGALASSMNGITTQVNETVGLFRQAMATLRTVIQESNGLIEAARRGNLNERCKTDRFQGGYRDLLTGFNETLDAMAAPVDEASAVLDRVSKRDLTARMRGDYKGDFAKIKEALNTTVKNLDEALAQVAGGAEQVASAAAQINGGSQALAQGASEQASSLEEVSSSLQEMSSMTKQNAGNAREAKSLSEGTRASTTKGVESMKRLSEAMDRIKDSSAETAKIVKTIDEIAFQTNLLALNAAVEAARAGDAGKGFAVVAEEVRNLAMRSAEAAKTTANLIEESVHNAEGGVAINDEVIRNLQEINDQVHKVSEVMSEIAAASEQQSQGVDQINVAIEQMNQVTQQTAANSEESASAAEELSGQAQEMLQMAGSFHLTTGGTHKPQHPHRAPNAAPAVTPAPKPRPAKATVRPKQAKPAAAVNPKDLIPFDDVGDQDVLTQF